MGKCSPLKICMRIEVDNTFPFPHHFSFSKSIAWNQLAWDQRMLYSDGKKGWLKQHAVAFVSLSDSKVTWELQGSHNSRWILFGGIAAVSVWDASLHSISVCILCVIRPGWCAKVERYGLQVLYPRVFYISLQKSQCLGQAIPSHN